MAAGFCDASFSSRNRAWYPGEAFSDPWVCPGRGHSGRGGQRCIPFLFRNRAWYPGEGFRILGAAQGESQRSRTSSSIRGSILVNISARHAEDPGSIPGRGVSPRHGLGKHASAVQQLAAWSSGTILAPGARSPGFNSRSSPTSGGTGYDLPGPGQRGSVRAPAGPARWRCAFLSRPLLSSLPSWGSLAAWSSGMILAQGVRGPGFNSRSSPSVVWHLWGHLCAANDSCGVRTHALADWRLKPAPSTTRPNCPVRFPIGACGAPAHCSHQIHQGRM